MKRTKPRQRERSAGAILGPNILIAAPLDTLCDEYRDERVEPVDSDRVPEPEPPGLLRRMIDRLAGLRPGDRES